MKFPIPFFLLPPATTHHTFCIPGDLSLFSLPAHQWCHTCHPTFKSVGHGSLQPLTSKFLAIVYCPRRHASYVDSCSMSFRFLVVYLLSSIIFQSHVALIWLFVFHSLVRYHNRLQYRTNFSWIWRTSQCLRVQTLVRGLALNWCSSTDESVLRWSTAVPMGNQSSCDTYSSTANIHLRLLK